MQLKQVKPGYFVLFTIDGYPVSKLIASAHFALIAGKLKLV